LTFCSEMLPRRAKKKNQFQMARNMLKQITWIKFSQVRMSLVVMKIKLTRKREITCLNWTKTSAKSLRKTNRRTKLERAMQESLLVQEPLPITPR
jgi:hypothetical protein